MTPTTRNGKNGLSVVDQGQLLRPRYAPGHVLMDIDLEAAVAYQLARTRMIFRALLGCGVICGLRVTAALDRCRPTRLLVTVAPGLALDGCGDPIELCKPETIPVDQDCDRWPAERYWVALRRREWPCAPRSVLVACDEEDGGETQPTRVQEGYELRLLAEALCTCWSRPPDKAREGETSEQHIEHLAACPACCASDEWVPLAALRLVDGKWDKPDHGVRRWLRPRLEKDPLRTSLATGDAGLATGDAGTEESGTSSTGAGTPPPGQA